MKSDRLGFPADPVLTLMNEAGATVRAVDDVAPSRDPRYMWTVTADGTYHIKLTDRAERGGERYVYQLLVVPPPQPDFSLTVKTSEFAVVPGAEKLTVPVRVTRKDGFEGDIEISVEGLPAGVTVQKQTHTKKSKPDINLEFVVAEKAAFSSGAIRIVAKGMLEDRPLERAAVASVKVSTVVTETTDQLWLAVGPKVPFELSFPATIQEAPRLAAFPFPITIKRDENFSGPIRLVGVDPDKRGTVIPMSSMVSGTEEKGAIPLIIQSMAIEGTTHRCRLMGVTEVKGPDGKLHSVFHVAKGSMAMGCQPNLLTLTATPELIAASAGDSITVTARIERRTSMGEVTISLTPTAGITGISAKSVTIPVGMRTAEIQIDIAAETKLAPRVELQLHAKSTKAGLPVTAIAPVVLVAP